ncbi:MAG TPA: SDR family oxidoreductase [Stellaceae bacterium]|nr:SDR family oxidoreductase [Stellaceae bacterium]
MRTVRDATVVITGASSGVGRAAARSFARQGARVALAARREEALHSAARECESLGGHAIAIPTDVTDIGSVRALAEEATRQLGPIRVWINNAGVGAVGRFADTPIEAHRRVIETNLLGYVNGAHAVVPRFVAECQGVLINNISMGAWAPAPYAVAYAASKFGLLGFSSSLRAELAGWRDIHVCDVFPSFLDTPGVQHGANYTGRVLKPAPPVYDPQRVADVMLRLALRPRSRISVGIPARLAKLAHVAPNLSGAAAKAMLELYLRQADPSPITDGNLYQPVAEGTRAHGGWKTQNGKLVAAALGALGFSGLAALGGLWASGGLRRLAR